ncbi:bifunctional diguanylate cyclase/phosphodiesterase [Pseudohongiella nitratireducens]|uniref:bifunctional diguanylate cyclase/phosphodiesterase n=1 Tax=Pseudohongiella nitratireducens TaxID=1768907 RepID=UPI0030EC3269|tara:strand:+ start:4644 stop:6428 length:1785 start_codon:yes stop_codon:yes gene_type:complete
MTLSQQLDELLRIIESGAITTLFQPIVSGVEKNIIGYEALTRGPSNSPLHSPLTLFAAAAHFGKLTELEFLCRRSALTRFAELKLGGLLFINVTPGSLLEKNHYAGETLSIIHEVGLEPHDVVIELTEHLPINDVELLQAALQHYRSMGFSIAIDDLGAGYSSLRLWTELQPDYVKIDRHFIDSIDKDAVKREFVGSILSMAKAARAYVIAEGIERAEEFNTLSDMGVDWVQGYWLERPSAQPLLDKVLLSSKIDDVARKGILEAGLHSLVIPVDAVHQSQTVNDVLQRFQQQPSLNSLAVVDDNGTPVGTVHCHALSQTMLKPYAKELHGRKSIAQMMDREALIVDVQQSLQRVSRLLTSRARQRLEEDFIIARDDTYLGLGRVIDVLRQITELQIRQAQSANPLTLLPGNVSIQECLERILTSGLGARLCYIDLDSFKPFNDIYGYGKGDEVLLGLAQILRDLCDSDCDFVGHIGGDDFMLVLRSADWLHRLESLNQQFQQLCRKLYKQDDLASGGFEAPDRDGNWRRYPLLNLSIGVLTVPASRESGVTAKELAELASHHKHKAKRQSGFSIVESTLADAIDENPSLYAAS